jgi:NADP-dependent aldehyde dehydrogenase
LLEIIERRPEPVPFFGELSSLNPVVVAGRGWRAR